MKTCKIEKWEDFETSAKKWMKEGPNGPNIFRGQANFTWSLSASLTRILNVKKYNRVNALLAEKRILQKFQDYYGTRDDYCNNLKSNDLLSWWEIMQHHSVPTRLLDWTKSPYASLYFAVSEQLDKDGALFVMDAGHLQWIQSLRNKDPEDKPNYSAFNELNKSVNGFPYEKSMAVISSPAPTDRMSAQHSSFTLSTEILDSHESTGNDITFGRCTNLSSSDLSIFQKLLIPKSRKEHFSVKLKEKGLVKESLFPDSRIIDDTIKQFLSQVNKILSG